MTRARCLTDFEGQWQLSRRIEQADGVCAELEGRASWTPQDAGMLYHEEGWLRMPGQQPMQAERRYFWDAALGVWFDDGRFFHAVPPKGGETDHWCDPDSYHVCYDFADWPAFKVEWTVKGPRKDYRSSSLYRRC